MSAQVFNVKHYNGTATTTPTKVALNRKGFSMVLANLDTVGNSTVEVSFDGGAKYFTLQAGYPPIRIQGQFFYFWVKSDGNADYCAIVEEG